MDRSRSGLPAAAASRNSNATTMAMGQRSTSFGTIMGAAGSIRGLIAESRERRKGQPGGGTTDVDNQTAVFARPFGRPSRMPKIRLSDPEKKRVHEIYEQTRIKHKLFPVRCLELLFRQCGIATLQWIAVAEQVMQEGGWQNIITEISTNMASALKQLAHVRDDPHAPDKQLAALMDSASEIGVPVISLAHDLLHAPHVDETQPQDERPPPLPAEKVQGALLMLCREHGVPDDAAVFVPESEVQLGLMRVKHVACAVESIIAATPIVLMDAVSKLARNLESVPPTQQICQMALAERVGAIYARAAAGFEEEGNSSYINFTEQVGVMSSVIELGTDPWAQIGAGRPQGGEASGGGGGGGVDDFPSAASDFDTRMISPVGSPSTAAGFARRGSAVSSPATLGNPTSPPFGSMRSAAATDDGNMSAFSVQSNTSKAELPESPLRKSSIGAIAENFGLRIESNGPSYMTTRDKERRASSTGTLPLLAPQQQTQSRNGGGRTLQQQNQQQGPPTAEQKQQQQQQQQLAVADLLTLDSIAKEFFQPQASSYANIALAAGNGGDSSGGGGVEGKLDMRRASKSVTTMLRVTNSWQQVAGEAMQRRNSGVLGRNMDDGSHHHEDEAEPSESGSEDSGPKAQDLVDRANAIVSPVALHPGTLVHMRKYRQQDGANDNNNSRNAAPKSKTEMMASNARARRRSSVAQIGLRQDMSFSGASSVGEEGSTASQSPQPQMSSGARLYHLRERLKVLEAQQKS